MTTRFDQRMVAITGAGAGIGAALARRFDREGAVVVADAVLFLVSDESSFFVGAVLTPNGGLVTA
jgi:NAD(P)-dependent dehydrogenase (short-subunit alcohol dehydrogenase family)